MNPGLLASSRSENQLICCPPVFPDHPDSHQRTKKSRKRYFRWKRESTSVRLLAWKFQLHIFLQSAEFWGVGGGEMKNLDMRVSKCFFFLSRLLVHLSRVFFCSILGHCADSPALLPQTEHLDLSWFSTSQVAEATGSHGSFASQEPVLLGKNLLPKTQTLIDKSSYKIFT